MGDKTGVRGLGLGVLLVVAGCFDPQGNRDDAGASDSTSSGATTSGAGSTTTSVADDTTSSSSGSTSPVATDSSTGAPQTGSSSSGPAAFCGDDIVQDDEMCDGGLGCEDDCSFSDYACNPLNNAGCPEGFRCGLIDAATENFRCMDPGPGGLGAACFSDPDNDSQCGDGLTCLFNFNTPLCDMTNCCVLYCNLEGPDVCAADEQCRPFFVPPMFQGLEHLGFCGEP